ncbi:Monomeric sarcosine oxidase [Maioricimonas rarisocia]|uniref:Monomeric sarcosine oxidase n=1 Tax=Maioricimonas rarisocia TaxID=2528026 RepID=A0A517Z516_9PLAN|nr:N-methyl-L-tryptophan oxidase [Maioricimonas rarisocia]QDU37537.1 Monomeric sarcosine oxidase [Maioricimonas rarisocia]
METYDCIVIGVGGIGSACLYHLARRGHRVLGLEQFDVPTDRGSSHGESRVIRQAYFEHPDYVPLLKQAYAGWSALEDVSGRSLYQPTGILVAGPADGEAVAGCRLAASQHQLSIENLSTAQAMGRFPGLVIPQNLDVVFERDAGFLFVEDCVRAHADAALAAGAELRTRERVRSWQSNGGTVRLLTDRGRYEASRVIITAGPWSAHLLSELNLPLSVLRKVMTWHADRSGAMRVENGAPVWFIELPEGCFYGVPGVGGESVKVGEHTRGEAVTDPFTVDRGLRASDLLPIRSMLKQLLPGVSPEPSRLAVCMYTNSPDGHFIVDRYPGNDSVVLAAGFSGHGFKFAPVIGEALADLADAGRTDLPIGFLGLSRLLQKAE